MEINKTFKPPPRSSIIQSYLWFHWTFLRLLMQIILECYPSVGLFQTLPLKYEKFPLWIFSKTYFTRSRGGERRKSLNSIPFHKHSVDSQVAICEESSKNKDYCDSIIKLHFFATEIWHLRFSWRPQISVEFIKCFYSTTSVT